MKEKVLRTKGVLHNLLQERLGSGVSSRCVWADVDSNAGHLFLAVQGLTQRENECVGRFMEVLRVVSNYKCVISIR